MSKSRRGEGPPASGHGWDASAAWLGTLGLVAVPRWHIEVSLEARSGSRFQLNVYAEEWGFAFHHARRTSWIRVTDIPFVHGRDDFGLLSSLPELPRVNAFVAALERSHAVSFPRSTATIRSNVRGATTVVRRWLAKPALELCRDEMHDGIRCTREQGHDGEHAFETESGVLRWKP